jgi:hypothetical protein
MHRCPWPGCPRFIPNRLWSCREHWFTLPNNLRAWIGRAYRHGIDTGTHPTDSYVRAHRAALEWIAQHSTETSDERHA